MNIAWLGEGDPTKMYAATIALWPFALTAAAVAVFYRINGILYERTVGVGEVLVAHGDRVDQAIRHPATTAYNIGEIIG